MRRTTQNRHEPLEQQWSAASHTLHSVDGRMTVTVYPGCPAYILVMHDGLTEGAVDAALMDMAEHLPAPCYMITLPRQWENC